MERQRRDPSHQEEEDSEDADNPEPGTTKMNLLPKIIKPGVRTL